MGEYIKMLRVDHWIKNLFILPGSLLGMLIFEINLDFTTGLHIILALVASSFIASANYLINEWLIEVYQFALF